MNGIISYIFLLAFLHSVTPFLFDYVKFINRKMNFLEFCDDYFVSPNFVKFERDLKELLFGQKIIAEKLVPILRNHFTTQPKKALVICMHGWTGSGKNYATKIMIDNIFQRKTDSQFVRFFNGRLHFPINNPENVDRYKLDIQNWIRGNVTNCPRTMFVFDEVNIIPPGVIDGIKPFLDYHEKIDNVDYRKSIFVFVSNIGGGVINKRFKEMWLQGKTRAEMEYKDFEPHLRNSLYATSGGFYSSSILEGHLVSLYLPFLPMGEEQVRECIAAEIRRQYHSQVSEKDVEKVLSEMEFTHERLSTSGCKRVSDLVAALGYKKFDEL